MGHWDSGLLASLVALRELCAGRSAKFDDAGLSEGARRLPNLASVVPGREEARREQERPSFLILVGSESRVLWTSSGDMLDYQVSLDITRFERDDDGCVALDVFWSMIAPKNGTVPVMRRPDDRDAGGPVGDCIEAWR